MKKKSVLYALTIIFCYLFCLNSVKAIDKYTIQDQQYFDSYSNCCYKDENKGTLGIYRNSGGVTLYVKKVPNPKPPYIFKNSVGQRLICTSNKDGSTVEIEAKVFEDATVFDTSKLNGGTPSGSVCTSSTSCSSKKEIVFSKCTTGSCSTAQFVEGYTSCERIGTVSAGDIYAKAVYKKINGKDGVAFYVTNSDKYVNKDNKFSCVKAGTDNERECVTVKVEAMAAISRDDVESGTNNLEKDTKMITDGDSKVDMIGYDSCHFDSTADQRNSYVNITNDNSVRVVSIPTENTNIYLKCKVSGTTSYRDVTVTVTPTATVFMDVDNPENNKKNDSENSNESSKDSDNSNNYEWGDPNKDCNFIFGDFSTPGTFGNMLRQILKFIQFLGPILVIVLTILDLVKAVASDDKEALTKLLKKTSKRLIYAVLLFVFPAILDKILKWTNVYGTCTILK